MIKNLVGTLNVLICFVLIFQLAGCGTILYPERRGQKAGNIDPGIAILDAVGLFFFIIPGVVAFGIDFTTGAIYLPSKSNKNSLNGQSIKQIAFDPKRSSRTAIEKIIEKETGQKIKLDQDGIKITKLDSVEDLKTRF